MGRFWACVFVLTAAAMVAMCVVAPQFGWWFPGDGVAKSTIGVQIDHLFYVILGLVTVVFVGTHAALGYALWTGAAASRQRAAYSHGNPTLEVIWTVIPGAVLLFLAWYQMDVWAQYRIKTFFPKDTVPIAEVTARQFEWRIRYPAPGKSLSVSPQPDDVYTVNSLVVPQGKPVLVQLRTEDVQHALFVPELRIKQDAVPGLIIPVWFQTTETGTFDLVCAELCGWGHYKMKAQLLSKTPEEFEAWHRQTAASQAYDGVTEPESLSSIRPAHNSDQAAEDVQLVDSNAAVTRSPSNVSSTTAAREDLPTGATP
jgi:cytochrome c oxidase subunit II